MDAVLARKNHPLGKATSSRVLLQEPGVEVLNQRELEEGRAGSPSRPFLRDELMSREKEAA
jgi:hypothetical protein